MQEKIWYAYQLPSSGLTFNQLKQACLETEQSNFDLFTTADHLLNPSDHSKPPLECWSILSALAAVTTKIKLGSLVSCYRFRDPTVLGKIATTIDHISNGRVVMGLGTGWHAPEFEQFFGSYPSTRDRVEGYKDSIAIIHSMFRNEITTYEGKIFSAYKTLNTPRPVQKPIPIIAAAFRKRMMEISCKYADIIHCLFEPDAQKIANQKNKIIESCKKINRDPSEIRIASGYQMWINPTEAERKRRKWMMVNRQGLTDNQANEFLENTPSTPEQHIEELKNLIDLGVSVFTFLGDPSKVKVFGESIIAKLR